MAFRVKSFLRPKQGEASESCADALAFSLISRSANTTAAGDQFGPAEAGRRYGRFAVADGVSEALLSGEWARELCGAFVEAGPRDLNDDEFAVWVQPHCSAFDARLRAWADARYAQDKKYWALPNKAYDEGSQATFLGLRVSEPDTDGAGTWRAISVGDCCLSWWTDSGMREAWPTDDPDEFDLTPGIVGTRGIGRGTVQTIEGLWQKTDMAVLTSDAMSVWLLRHQGAGIRSWRDWDDSEFDAWLAQERDAKRIRDDDCAILFVWWEDESAETGDPSHNGMGECAVDTDEEQTEPPDPSQKASDGCAADAATPMDDSEAMEPPPQPPAQRRGAMAALRRIVHAALSWRVVVIIERNR